MEHNTQKNSSKQTREPKNDQHLTQSTHNRNSNNITQLCPESSSFTSHSRVTTTRDHCRKNIKPEFYQPTKSNFQMGYKQKKYKNGEEYNGEWNNNKRHGMGIHQWPDNRIYEGQFKDDLMHGHGKYQWPDNRLYEGSFVQDHMTGRGYYFQDKRDPLLEEISGEFLNGVLHGRGVCFKKIVTNNVTTGLIITVGYCWNRGTLHHGFEIIVDTNNAVQSIKQFRSNCKYSFDPRGGGGDYFQEDSGAEVLHSPNVSSSVVPKPTSAASSQDKLNNSSSNSIPLLNLMNISSSSFNTQDSISPRGGGGCGGGLTPSSNHASTPTNQGSMTPRTRSSPRTPRGGSHLIKPAGTTEIKIEQIEFIDASELAQAKAELLEKQSNLVQAWKEKLNNVQEKIKTLTKQKVNLESKLAEAKEELAFYHNKDIETEQRLSQYITQHKDLFEEYEMATNSKIQTLETIISELNTRRERDLTLKNQELEHLRNSLHQKIEALELEWRDRYNRLESQVELLDDDKKVKSAITTSNTSTQTAATTTTTTNTMNTATNTTTTNTDTCTSKREDITDSSHNNSNPNNNNNNTKDSPPLLSNTEFNQQLIDSIALSPHRPTRHRRSISNIHHAHLPSSLLEQQQQSVVATSHHSSACSSCSSTPSSSSACSTTTNFQHDPLNTLTSNTTPIHSSPPADDFDIETTLRTTTYKTANNVNTPTYETAQQKEAKNIGRPRSNSQDNSSATSSLDIVRGTLTGSHLLSSSPSSNSSTSQSHVGDDHDVCLLQDASSNQIVDCQSSPSSLKNSSERIVSIATESSENSFTNSCHAQSQQHEPLSPLQKHSSLSSIPSGSNHPSTQHENSTKLKTNQTDKDRPLSMKVGNNKIVTNQSNWISADILYQKIRENLKKTSNFSELGNSSKNVNKEQIDYRQFLKKKH
nr:unnamed protein product [Naegleria fowleri]